MSQPQANNPLHGLTLRENSHSVGRHYGWEGLDAEIHLNCFYKRSFHQIISQKPFLRRTQWARDKVETFYIPNVVLLRSLLNQQPKSIVMSLLNKNRK